MLLIVDPQATIRCLYSEQLDLARFGSVTIRRASHVEPDAQGHWWADLSLLNGPMLGPFSVRSEALDSEQRWIEEHHLLTPQ